ncbi:hypothetical protein GCM10025868_21070 [Angustibacter aerolatus]|uniref:Uncharacterized protein n=1 Tax=Angustibacter aerolatus TaxID=1162965 RepID=A0ABQ6JGF5_9ACTN|nr:hypothetical protein GCM10025868_21070 [Angustibacter aerolatus]
MVTRTPPAPNAVAAMTRVSGLENWVAFSSRLRDHVRRGEGDVADERRVGLQREVDAVVPLDLGDGGADHVGQRHRTTQAASGVDAREDDERLGVPAHPGREVVQAEQVVERVRVLLGALQAWSMKARLARQEDVVAAGDVDEHLGDRGAQRGLLLRDADRRLVHVHEGEGQ